MIKTAIGFLLGCVLCMQLSTLPSFAIWALLLVPVLLTFRLWFLSALLLGFTFTAWQAQQHLSDRLTYQQAGLTVLTQGKIGSIPQQDGHRIKFLFLPDDKDLPKRIPLSWYYAPEFSPKAGETWQLEIKLKPPQGTLNPGGFDYERWLFSQRIGATGYVRKSADNQRVTLAPATEINHLREHIASQLNDALPEGKQLGLLKGLSIGLRDDLRDEHWQVLQQTGTNHLLAISGLHIGLAAAIGFFLFRWLGSTYSYVLLYLPAQKLGALGGLLFALSYALLAGWSIPTQRAFIMVSVVLVTLLLNRPVRISDTLAMSLLAVLIFDPFAVLNAGFWLSYAAVGLILLTCSGRFPRQKHQWLTIHIWIAIGLIPLLILLFGQFSIAAPLANVWAVPFVSLLVIPLLLMGLALLFVIPSLGILLLQLTDWLLNTLWLGLEWMANLPMAHLTITGYPIPLILLVAVGLLMLLLPRGMPFKYVGLFACLPLIFYQPSRPNEGDIHLTVLDVGQGLSVIVETQNHLLVYDTGAKFSSRFDMGKIAVVPYLTSRLYQHIDTLLISHADNDHRGGMESIQESLKIKHLLSNEPDTIHDSLFCEAGTAWQWDQVQFELLWPTQETPGNRNNRSCVLKVTAKNLTVLLPGDIEKESELELVKRYAHELKADILIAPHHGSRTSSTKAFIEAVSPERVVFSVGRLNQYGFPKKDVVERYTSRGTSVHRTDQHGAVLMYDPHQIIHWREHAQKIWTAPSTE